MPSWPIPGDHYVFGTIEVQYDTNIGRVTVQRFHRMYGKAEYGGGILTVFRIYECTRFKWTGKCQDRLNDSLNRSRQSRCLSCRHQKKEKKNVQMNQITHGFTALNPVKKKKNTARAGPNFNPLSLPPPICFHVPTTRAC